MEDQSNKPIKQKRIMSAKEIESRRLGGKNRWLKQKLADKQEPKVIEQEVKVVEQEQQEPKVIEQPKQQEVKQEHENIKELYDYIDKLENYIQNTESQNQHQNQQKNQLIPRPAMSSNILGILVPVLVSFVTESGIIQQFISRISAKKNKILHRIQI